MQTIKLIYSPRSWKKSFLMKAIEQRDVSLPGPPIQQRLGCFWDENPFISLCHKRLLIKSLLRVQPCARRCELGESVGESLETAVPTTPILWGSIVASPPPQVTSLTQHPGAALMLTVGLSKEAAQHFF